MKNRETNVKKHPRQLRSGRTKVKRHKRRVPFHKKQMTIDKGDYEYYYNQKSKRARTMDEKHTAKKTVKGETLNIPYRKNRDSKETRNYLIRKTGQMDWEGIDTNKEIVNEEIIIIQQSEEKPKDPKKLNRENAIEAALKEKYPGVEFTWRDDGDEIHVKLGDPNNTWSPTAKHYPNRLIEQGKDLIENPREERLIQATINDIPEEIARAAYRGTSWSPEKRGMADRAAYVEHINKFHDELIKKIPVDQRPKLKELLEKYQHNYKAKLIDQLNRHSGLVSSFIAGPSNFPAARMNKKNDIYGRKFGEFLEWDYKAKNGIKRTLGLLKNRGISSDDKDAIAKIDRKILKREMNHERMKAANKLVRSKKFTDGEKIDRLKNDMNFSDAVSRNLLKEDFAGRTGYASYNLSNNSSEIRRLKKRRESLIKMRSQKTTVKVVRGVMFEDNVEANRFRVFFDGKPDATTRSKLKSNGFRWSPKAGAWQSYRGNNAEMKATQALENYQPD